MQRKGKAILIMIASVIIYCVLCTGLILSWLELAKVGNVRVLFSAAVCLLPLWVYITVKWQEKSTFQQDSEASNNNKGYQFDKVNIDIDARILRFDEQAEEVQPKVFDLLIYMLQNRARIVTKEELIEALWPSVVVSDSSLTQAIKRLRDTFRKHGFDQDIIRTVARKGYQFNYEKVTDQLISRQSELSSNENNRYPIIVSILIGALLIPVIWRIDHMVPSISHRSTKIDSIMLVPFRDLSGDADFSYFAQGLSESVTNSLSTLQEVKIIASASARKIDVLNEQPLEVGRQLGLSHILLGSVQKISNQLRVNVSLVSVETGEQIWTHQFDRQMTNVFALHDDIAQQIAQQSSIYLEAVTADEPSNDKTSEAYLNVLKADTLSQAGDLVSLQQATQLYREALALQSNNAEAVLGLANVVYRRTTTGDIEREQGYAESLRLAKEALQIKPGNSHALVLVGEIQYRHFWNFKEAEASYLEALKHSPSYAQAHIAFARYLSKSGRHHAAVEHAKEAARLNPLSNSVAVSLSIRLMRANLLEEARLVLDELYERNQSDPNIPWLETNWHLLNGDYAKALEWISQEELEYLRLSLTSIVLQKLGRTEQAQSILASLIEKDGKGATFQIAEVYAQAGQKDIAFAWLEKAYSHGDPGLTELYSSFNLSSLYNDRRFYALAKRLGLPPLDLE